MAKGGAKILICLFALSGFFYCAVSLSLVLRGRGTQATSSPMVLLNEIAWMGSVENENHEWIELKNVSSEIVDLSGWTMVAADGTPDIALNGTIGPDGYFLLERTSEQSVPSVTSSQIYTGALGNGGETFELRDASGAPVDLVAASTSWPAGNNQSKQTMERGIDGNWHSSALPGGTPGFENSMPTSSASDVLLDQAATSTVATSTETVPPVPAATVTGAGPSPSAEAELEITEILPSPKGSDAAGEFIELHNAGTTPADATGWRLASGERQYVIAATSSRSNVIPPNGYLAIWRSESRLVLPNDQGQAVLYSPEKTAPRQAVSYEKAPEGKSYAKNEISEWRWSGQATPGEANAITAENQPPEADWSVKSGIEAGEMVLFDSSDTTDPEDDKLSFVWRFGDGASSTEPNPVHAFQSSGRFKVELSVGDGTNRSAKSRTITVTAPKATSTAKVLAIPVEKEFTIIINELLPDPAGEDYDGEWVELYNTGSKDVDLLGWQVDDASGGSKAFRFEDSVTVKPLSFYLLDREDSGLALNNGSDEARVFDGFGRLVDSIRYSGAKEGLSYSRDKKNNWQWSAPTAGGPNQLVTTASKKNTPASKKKTAVSQKKTAAPSKKERFTVEGVVTALPGHVAKQVFYIAGTDCWQIYSYRRDFPKLKLGDRVRASGEVENIKGEKRLKTSKLADIVVLGSGVAAAPDEVSCQEVGEAKLSRLVKISGDLTRKTSTLWYLDDGSGEVAVYVAKPLADNFTKVEEGEHLDVVGLVTPATTGVRIVPRGIIDIVWAKAAQAEEYPEAPLSIPARDSSLELRQYLQLVGIGILLALFGWWLRRRYAI